jgi:hypothetical protein
VSVPDLDRDLGNWLAGFTAGEGCFAIVKRYAERGVVRHGQSYRPHFRLTVRDDELPTLVELRDRLGGTLRRKPAHRYPSQGYESKPAAEWTVDRKRDLARLVRVFDAHPLRAKKRRDYAIWREAVRLHAQLYRGKRGAGQQHVQARLHVLYHQLRAVRAYVPPDAPAPAPPPEPEAQTTLDDLWEYDDERDEASR